MNKCYKCEAEITSSNVSKEHIIPNGCGGRLTSNSILCRDCNSKFGSSFDARLVEQTNHLTNLLIIKRHKGNPRPFIGHQNSTGGKYLLQSDGRPTLAHPIINEKVEGNQVSLSISADSLDQLKAALYRLKKDKYPTLDVEEYISKAKKRKEYLSEPITFSSSIGGEDTFKSILKTCIGYYMSNGGERRFIAHLLNYLEGIEDGDFVWMHYPKKSIYEAKVDEVSHIIRLIGDNNERVLYCYVELFNIHCYIVALNLDYNGPAIDLTYIYDLISGNSLDASLPLNLKREFIIDFFPRKIMAQVIKFKRDLQGCLKLQCSAKMQGRLIKS